MSIEYVSLAEAREYSRIQHDALDNTITLLIRACSAGVKNYLKSSSAYMPLRDTDDDYVLGDNHEPEVEIQANGSKDVRDEVKLAVLYWVDLRLKNPDAEGKNGEPPAVVVSLLYPLRDPALQ